MKYFFRASASSERRLLSQPLSGSTRKNDVSGNFRSKTYHNLSVAPRRSTAL